MACKKVRNMENIIKVSMFESAQNRYASGVVNLWDWLFLEDYRTVLIKELRNESDLMKRRELKELLPAITVSCVCSERRTEKIYEYTNLICIDIDGKDNPSISNIEDLKIKLGELPYIMYCGLSASGNGLFCIIPYADPTNHKNVFEAIKNDFEEMGIIIDKSCGDICRLRFLSHDTQPYVNKHAEVYTSKPKTKSNAVEYIYKPKQKYKTKPPKPRTLLIPNAIETFLLPNNFVLESATPLTKKQKVERLLNEITRNQVDITYYYDDWIAIGNIIKNMFGEEGRALFHKVSSFYPNYDYDETDREYSAMIIGRYRYNSDRLFEIAAEYKLISPIKK